ncbi:hypothetical protein [Caballeronia terrestris]|uniref:hypothetical protein n=1 Tax=Caballeronia terrestris TaxID=1226301 RepID=UPI000F74B21E|nr:hypothetical protein [Caballeronia terrestris]
MSIFIAHLQASDWRNASDAMSPLARNFCVYFALFQPPEEVHCTKRRESGANADAVKALSRKRIEQGT